MHDQTTVNAQVPNTAFVASQPQMQQQVNSQPVPQPPVSRVVFGNPDGLAPVLYQRWTKIPISSVEGLEIVNPKFDYQSAVPVLISADLKMSLTIPFRIDSLSHFAANISRSTTLTSEEVRIDLGVITVGGDVPTNFAPNQNQNNSNAPSFPSMPQDQHHTFLMNEVSKVAIVVPIFNGPILSKPILDRIGSKSHDYIHYTFQIDGVCAEKKFRPATWYLRMRVNRNQFNRIEDVSVTNNLIDFARIGTSWNHFAEWMTIMMKKFEVFVSRVTTRTYLPTLTYTPASAQPHTPSQTPVQTQVPIQTHVPSQAPPQQQVNHVAQAPAPSPPTLQAYPPVQGVQYYYPHN